MFSIYLLGLAAATGSAPVIVVDDRPTISIDLARYDVRQPGDRRLVEARIHAAAKRVCIRGYGVSIYFERLACVKSAIAEGNRQLDKAVAKNGSASLTGSANSISSK